MKVKTFLIILMGVFFCLPIKVEAAIVSGAYLLQICERTEGGGEVIKGGHTACQAYIAGVIDYHKLLRSLGTAPSLDFCVPEDIQPGELQDVVWDYLQRNAQSDAFIAAPAVSLALFETFPCP